MLNLIILISPVLLLIIIGILIRARGISETAGQRYFLFLAWTTIGALALTLLNWIFPRSIFGYGMALFPVIPGLVVLTLLHGREWNSLSRRAKIPILSAAGILLTTIIVQLVRIILNGDTYQRESLFFGMALLTVAVFMFIVWRWGKRSPLLLFLINVLYLTIFLAFDLGSLPMFTETAPGQMQMHPLSVLAYLAIPSLTIPVMAMLTTGALNASSATDEIKKSTWGPILGRLTLVIILLGLLLYVYRWLWLWDGTEYVTIDLRFLDANTGEICQPSQSKWTVRQSNGLRDHYAWLPDGRFLYVTEAGAMTLFRPCADEVEDLAGRYPLTFTHVMSSGEGGERILLKNEEAYWLMDGISLEARKIEGVPTESYRPWYDWSPGGGRLALSLMSGAEVEDEASLYIVDWASAQVEQVIPLEDASDANLPIVEWLTRDELLLHGNTLTVLDFRSEPPIVTDILRDIFLLDIAYPFDVSSMDSVRSHSGDGYYIGVQVNHPRNADAYVYSSKTGQVEVFQHDVSTLIFFPDGQWMRLTKWEDEPTYRDEYELVWMGQSIEQTRLKVEGHVPRAHPQLFPRYLPNSSQLVFHSSQGISLISIPDGETVRFWELASYAEYFDVFPSPNGEALIVASDGDGLYYIPLSSK